MTLTALALGDDLDELRAAARAFATREIAPRVDAAENDERFPRELFGIAGKQGFIGSHYPDAVGGGGGDLRAALVIREEFSYVSVGLSSGLGHQDHVGTAYLNRFGSPQQHERWLRPALSGEFVIAMAITEPDAGSDVRSMRTTARRTAGGWAISGRKTFITNGPLADGIAVTARIDGTDRFGVFIVLRGDPGFVAERAFHKLGCRSSEVGELLFDHVVVPGDRCLSSPDGGTLADILDVLIVGRAIIAASAVGLARRALDLGMSYARTRHAFGVPIAAHQEISMKFARASAQLRGAELLAYHAAESYASTGVVPVLECSQAKLLAAETAVDIADQMMRVFGGAGYMAESEIERLYRDARFFTVVEGTAEIQHRIIASELGLMKR
ncbi:acyl-CoA dehydrogenase [Microbacterium sp. PI-1]|uniref:acyl-CoA dehydrogenase family protein n=1 Tax=Microbacterium sp. PI-1 TaxID=2545631 RepID=UPI00103E24A9|nr:acyl-CoA dehydrogenase family protein [Microbacterium sp. PI-1]TCJ21970.1 acyl-CoA dehydrogenase [Microbacterium sp. PI-1]